MVRDDLSPLLFGLFHIKFPALFFQLQRNEIARFGGECEAACFLPVIVCFARRIVCHWAVQHSPAAPSPAGQPGSDCSALHSRTRPAVLLRAPGHMQLWHPLAFGVLPCRPGRRYQPPAQYVSCPTCRAGILQGLIPAAPKMAVTSTHLEPRPVAFWQARAEIFACLLLSIDCWALQIKASSVHRGSSLVSARGAWGTLLLSWTLVSAKV